MTAAGASAPTSIVGLIGVCDVEGNGPDYVALSERPWLSIAPISLFAPGRWFKMRYRLGLYDRPTRPLISYRRGAQEIGRHILPGPVLGRAEWIGVVPKDASEVWISPVAEAGPFNFVIEAIEVLSISDLFRRGLKGDRSRFFSALGTWALGWQNEARENFCWATQHAPMSDWPDHRNRLSVAPDLEGAERPRCDWSKAPTVRLIARLADGVSAEDIEATIDSLRAQIFPRWTLCVFGGVDNGASWIGKDPRVSRLKSSPLEGADEDLMTFIAFGDRLAPHALACFVESSHRAPEARVIYCDEDNGATPIFKPDWSPRLQAARPYVGRLMLTRLSHARSRIDAKTLDERVFAREILRDMERRDVLHIPRFLIRATPAPSIAVDPPPRTVKRPSVTIVMPTRDRAELLRKSVTSLLEKTSYSAFDLVIVDNGTTDARALAVLQSLTGDSRVKLLRAPGPFNFSHLCNLGAAHARGEVLIFLNNDVEIIDRDWIDKLAPLALDPKVGAVGCKLLHRDGRIQHAGIVLGLGEAAGHCDAGAEANQLGWLGRNGVIHEASAVTGACLAVERAKFDAAGGFDAVHLPIEFNDIDLCLRLEELEFQTLWTPFARIVHFESASRGKATFRRLEAHAEERAYFRRRWGHRLRDDPFHHPGLSLFSLSLMLA
ncbi:MAG: glycosyltransferase family 2 protein [Methylocella sp.]